MTAGKNVTPADRKATDRLRWYWSHGEGAAQIGWGTPGDFARCVTHLEGKVKDPEGYCAERHHDALGIWPATHAKQVRDAEGKNHK
ncbi:hypothetical protein A5747_13380 [Mycobacterium sp. IS-836]|uniref:hypothetical protein n=1 Tax=Mycobacterium sp. IS-836 TaxID=1834160 RepID=UPI00096CA8EE|nr:hypothetical protein [Mycobacterium sp. IS-836]OMC55379.1 hypothetical protein A5747_13380 [Mycobacterium sp. IS-836]